MSFKPFKDPAWDVALYLFGILAFVAAVAIVGVVLLPLGLGGYGIYRFIKYKFPEPPPPPIKLPYDGIEPATADEFVQRTLERWSLLPPHDLADAMMNANLIGDKQWPMYDAIIEDLPEHLRFPLAGYLQVQPPQFSVPAYTVLNRGTVSKAIAPFYDDVPMYQPMINRLEANFKAMKGVMPHDHPGDMKQIVDGYLIGTPLWQIFNAPVPFDIPTHRFGAHGIIIAPPEHGKTQLLSTFIARFLPDADTGIVVLDPHGDLFASLKDKVPTERLVVLDPSTDPPAMNVFDFGNANEVQILQAFSYLMAALTGGMSEKQAAIIPYLLKIIRAIPGATVQTLLELVTERLGKNDVSKFMPYVQKLDPLDRDFFVHQFFGKMQETKDAIAWKLSAALSYDAFRAMFTAPRNSFDAFAAMEQSKVVLVKGSESVLGEYGLPVFLQFVVAQFFLAALKRDQVPEKDRKLCVLFADEASHVFNSQTTRILTECRKYRFGFMAATQVIQQIPQDVKAAIYGATAIKIAGPVSYTDAMLLAREMHTSAEEIRVLKSHQRSHAEWMFYVSNITDQAVKVSVPFGALDRLEARPVAPESQPHPNVIITPPPKKECPFKERDIIQVTIGGYDHYSEGVRVRKIIPEAEILFVDGSESGIPFKDCYHFKPKEPKPPEAHSPPEEAPRERFDPP